MGEHQIGHTPCDEKIRVFTGKAFDLVVERTELDTRQIGPHDREVDVKIEVRNRKETDSVTVIVQEDLYGDWTIRQSSQRRSSLTGGGAPAGQGTHRSVC